MSLAKKWRKMFFLLSRIWGKEKILSPHEESNLGLLDSAIQCSTTEPQRLCGDEVYYKVHMTHILHTAGISNVNSIIFVNRIRKMVSFSSWGNQNFFSLPYPHDNIFLYTKSTSTSVSDITVRLLNIIKVL